MNKKKKIVTITAMSLVLGSSIITANASNGVAVRVKPAGFSEDRHGKMMNEETRTALANAITGADYAAWVTAMKTADAEGRFAASLNEATFQALVSAYKLRESGDEAGAREALRQAGVPRELGMGKPASDADMESLRLSLENADYSAWKAAMDKIGKNQAEGYATQENFNIIVRAYKMQKSGDVSGARTLLRNSDIPGWLFAIERGGQAGEGMEDVGAEDQAALMAAYQSGDYQAWKALMEGRGGKILEVINADNFARFAQAKVFQSQGQHEEARQILEGLGLPFHGGKERPVQPNGMEK
jgi:hypothetical protein